MATWQRMAIQPTGRNQILGQILLFPMLVVLAGFVQTAKADSGVVNKVMIELNIEGLPKEGCEIVIEPGHPGCKFKRVRYRVDVNPAMLQPIEVTTFSLDRDCSFAITIKEPGMPEYKVRRGLRLAKPVAGAPEPPESYLKCHLATPSQIQQARAEEAEARTKAR